MTAVDQIRAAASQGLTRAEIEAGIIRRQMTADEVVAFNAARGIWKLREAKRKAEKRAAGPLSVTERTNRHRDAHANIDPQLREARTKIDWKRRRKAEKSPAEWMKTYCLGTFIDDPPPPKGVKIIDAMYSAVGAGRPYLVLMSRGFGKTSYTEGVVSYCLATARCKFCVVVSLNKEAAAAIVEDIVRLFGSEPFATDYPDIALPIILKDGSWKRKQTSGGKSTDCRFTNGRLVFPRVVDDDGNEVPTAHSFLIPKALKAVRGTKRGTLRPDLIVLDDLQTTEDADNPQTVAKKLRYIRNDIMNAGGKSELSIINTATVIASDDLAERLAEDKTWSTTRFKAFDHFPDDFIKDPRNGLWAQYWAIWDKDSENGDKHPNALKFYRKNRKAMDAGADVLNPMRFDKDRDQISCVQHLMDRYHKVGRSAFMAEMQMQPDVGEFVISINPRKVREKSVDMPRFFIPDGTAKVVVGTDLNLSYAISTVILAVRPDTTAHVIYHETFPTDIDGKLTSKAYYDAVYAELERYAARVRSFGIHIDAWGIDINGKNFDAGADFCKAKGLPVYATQGKDSYHWTATPRTRIEDAVGRTVMLGDAREQVKRGAGRKWLWFDSDFYREQAQVAMAAPVGAVGGLTLYEDESLARDDFAVQFCKERLEWKREHNGRTEYRWKSGDPHDLLDATAIAYAVAAQLKIQVGRSDIKAAATRIARRRAAVSVI